MGVESMMPGAGFTRLDAHQCSEDEHADHEHADHDAVDSFFSAERAPKENCNATFIARNLVEFGKLSVEQSGNEKCCLKSSQVLDDQRQLRRFRCTTHTYTGAHW